MSWWNIQKNPTSTFLGRVPMRVDSSGTYSGRFILNISEKSIVVILVVVVVVVVEGVEDVGEEEAQIREGACLDHSIE